MKCHVGVDAHSGLVHTIAVTAANAHDITQAANLIREEDEVVYGDSAYLGIQKRSEMAGDPHLSSIDYRINRRPSSPLAYPTGRWLGEAYIQRFPTSNGHATYHTKCIGQFCW